VVHRASRQQDRPHHHRGVITNEFTVPTANSAPQAIAAGPDGALWFSEDNGNNIGRIATAGAITETAIPTARSFPAGIAAGPDGALWFVEQTGNKIGRIGLPTYSLTVSAAQPEAGTVTGGSPSLPAVSS
jgi:virginiamycin B lyase